MGWPGERGLPGRSHICGLGAQMSSLNQGPANHLSGEGSVTARLVATGGPQGSGRSMCLWEGGREGPSWGLGFWALGDHCILQLVC